MWSFITFYQILVALLCPQSRICLMHSQNEAQAERTVNEWRHSGSVFNVQDGDVNQEVRQSPKKKSDVKIPASGELQHTRTRFVLMVWWWPGLLKVCFAKGKWTMSRLNVSRILYELSPIELCIYNLSRNGVKRQFHKREIRSYLFLFSRTTL